MPRAPKRPMTEKQAAALAAGRAKGREMIRTGELVYGGKGGGARRVRPGEPDEQTGPTPIVVADPPTPTEPAAAPRSRRITWPKEEPRSAPAPAPAEPVAAGSAPGLETPAPPPAAILDDDPPPQRGGFLSGLLEAFK